MKLISYALYQLAKIYIAAFFIVSANMGVSQAQTERITSYNVDIKIQDDASLLVTENITVNALGQKIKRGIYRDFPMYFEEEGQLKKVDFELVSVKRNQNIEAYHMESHENYKRIYIGEKDKLIDAGEHHYIIQYKTARHIRKGIELYWNATGNFWKFPIQHASVKVHAASSRPFKKIDFFTGRYGQADEKKATGKISNNGRLAYFEITEPLRKREGLTIALQWNQARPLIAHENQRLQWWLQDNSVMIFGMISLFIISYYYYSIWSEIGRDPKQGIIAPQWRLDDSISPAMVNYIDNKGFKGSPHLAISAAFISLAKKGFVKINQSSDVWTITAETDEAEEKQKELPKGEKFLFKHLIHNIGSSISFNKKPQETISEMVSGFTSKMEIEHRDVYYKHNINHFIKAVILSIFFSIGVIILAIFYTPYTLNIFLSAFLPFIFALFLCYIIYKLARDNFQGLVLDRLSNAIKIGGFIVLAALFMVFFSEISLEYNFIAKLIEHQLLIILFCIFFINLLFYFLIGAPTPLGRSVMDDIEGLKIYISMAETERLKLTSGPQMSLSHFEDILPYAIALGLEDNWTNQFSNWLNTAQVAEEDTIPSWYYSQGKYWGFSDSFTAIGLSMGESMLASIPAPKNSSSGFSGGGFSGGGSGGGGGGGW